MPESHPGEWLNDHRNGDPEGARRIFEHFSRRLCQLAQRHLSTRLRQRVDGEDVVQSVFRTFFVRDAQGQFQIDDSDELWRLLVTITLRKARGVWRKNSSARRSVGREVPFDDCGSDPIGAMSREPSVVEALVLADEIETLLDGLDEPHTRAFELRMGGYSPTEAAAIMGISRQAFYRLLDPIKTRLALQNSSLSNTTPEPGNSAGDGA